MVWGNFEEDQIKTKNLLEASRTRRLANPTDRMGALFVDVLISYGISGLLVSPLARMYTEAQILGEYGKVFLYAVSMLSVHLLVFIVFQSLVMFRLKRSIGQRFFGIKTVSIWTGKTPRLSKIFLRNSVFVFGAPLILPLVGVFTDIFRRMYYEKLSDTISISDSKSFALSPSRQERSFVKGILLPAYLWIFALIASGIGTGAEMLLEEDDWLVSLNKSVPHCESVVDVAKDWPKENGERPSRLLIALSLYSSEQVNKECLLSEADAAFLRKKEITYAYLAKAFALEGVVELSDDYLLKVCEQNSNSDACLFTKLINYWADSDFEKADHVVNALMKNADSFMKVYAIQHYMSRKKYESAYKLIAELSENRHLDNFLARYRSKALWNVGREREAEIAFTASKSKLDPVEARSQQAWLCWKNMESSCDSHKKTVCNGVGLWQDEVTDVFRDVEALAVINYNECSNKNNRSRVLASLSSRVSPAMKVFISYLEQDRSVAMMELLDASLGAKISGVLSHEVVKRLLANDIPDAALMKLEQYLLVTNRFSEEWEESIIQLINTYYDKGMNSRAENLAIHSLKMFDENLYFHRKLAVNAFQKSRSKWMREFTDPLQENSRAPASAKATDQFYQESSHSRFRDILRRIKK